MKKTIIFIFAFSLIATGCSLTKENQSFTSDTVDEKLDESTVINAVETMNIDLCNTIKNEDQKFYCKGKVNDQILMSQAETEVSLDLCSEIVDADTKSKCEILVNEKISQQEKAEELKADQEKLAEIEQGDDVEKCNEIEDLSLKNQCETNIYLKKARDLKDPQYCDKITDENLQEMCKAQLVETEPVN